MNIALLLLSKAFAGALICNDGTQSPTCDVCDSGCCSSHGGCTYTGIQEISKGVYLVNPPVQRDFKDTLAGQLTEINTEARNERWDLAQEQARLQATSDCQAGLSCDYDIIGRSRQIYSCAFGNGEGYDCGVSYGETKRKLREQMDRATALWNALVERVGKDNARMWIQFGTKSHACSTFTEDRIIVKTDTDAILILAEGERARLVVPDQSDYADAMTLYDQIADTHAPACNK